jgi:hypothetical protein
MSRFNSYTRRLWWLVLFWRRMGWIDSAPDELKEEARTLDRQVHLRKLRVDEAKAKALEAAELWLQSEESHVASLRQFVAAYRKAKDHHASAVRHLTSFKRQHKLLALQ